MQLIAIKSNESNNIAISSTNIAIPSNNDAITSKNYAITSKTDAIPSNNDAITINNVQSSTVMLQQEVFLQRTQKIVAAVNISVFQQNGYRR